MKEINNGLFVPDSFDDKKDDMKVRLPFIVEKAAPPANPIKGMASRYGGDPFRSAWAVSYLRACAAQEFAYIKSPWVTSAIDLIVSSCIMDQYSIETEDETLRWMMEAFLYNIAPRDSFDRLLESIYRDLMINGNWYGRIFYLGKKPAGIERINFKQIVPDIPEDGTNLIKTYSIYPSGAEGISSFKLKAHEVLHFTLNRMGDNGTGLSKLECLDLTIAMERYAQAYQNGFFINGVKAGDVYAADGSMTEEQYERDRIALEAYTKAEKSYAPMFLSGPWKLLSRGQELRKDGDFLNLRNWNREEILSVYSVPYSLISTDKVGTLGSNGKQEDRESFMNFTVSPLQKTVFEQFNRQFITGILGNQNVRLLPPGRPKIRLDDLNAAVAMTKVGFTGNEIRSALNLDLIEGLDEPLWFMSSAAIIGIPGDPDSVYLTRMGPIGGAPTALPETIADASDQDPKQDTEYDKLKEKINNDPTYKKLKDQAGNQPTANTLSQSNDAFSGNSAQASAGAGATAQGAKKNITTNPVASSNGAIPNNSQNQSTMPTKTKDIPPRQRKKKRPNPPGRYKSKVEPK